MDNNKINSGLVYSVNKISKKSFKNESFIYYGDYYNKTTLWTEAKKYKPENISIEGIDISDCLSKLYNINSINSEEKCIKYLAFWKRVYDADLSYPIILTPLGIIADGRHRILKSILQNKKYILAIKLLKMPKPDGVVK